MRYEGTRLYLADPKHEDYYYESADDLQKIDMDLTAGEVIQKAKELFPFTEKPLVIVKMFYVSKQK